MSQALGYITTTGAAVAIGSGGILVGGVLRSTTATTVTIKDGATSVIVMSAEPSITFAIPIAMQGPVTMTSSGGTPTIIYRNK